MLGPWRPTLVGLLFVGLSLHIRAVLSRSEVRSLARVTLANFGLLLLVSLFMVIPQGPSAASPELLISGLFTLIVIAPSLVAAGALLADYILTVAVSVTAGVFALSSAAPSCRAPRLAR